MSPCKGCQAVNYAQCTCSDRLSFVERMVNRSKKEIQDECEHLCFEDYEEHQFPRVCEDCDYEDDGSDFANKMHERSEGMER